LPFAGPNQQPAGSRSDNSRRTRSSPNQEGTPHRDDGVMRPFEQASLVEFVRRADGPPEAGVCTHQGCQAVFRPSDDRLPARVMGRPSRRRGSYIRDRQHWHRCRA